MRGNISPAPPVLSALKGGELNPQRLKKLVTSWSPDKIAECISVATFKARALGDAEFDKDE
jgi:hypothetical protein